MLIVILVLAVPFRYDIKARYHEGVKAKGGVHWLLKLIHVKFAAINAQVLVKVNVLGHTFKKLHVGNWGEKPPKPDPEPEEARPVSEGEDIFSAQDEPESDAAEPAPEAEESSAETEEKPAEETAAPEPEEKPEEEKAEEAPDSSEASAEAGQEEGKSLDERLEELEEKWDALMEKYDTAEAFLSDEKNQKTISLILKQLKKLGKHLLPTHFLLDGDLGLKDPAKTANLMAKIYRFYPLLGENIRLRGVYDRPETNLYAELKGRLRLGIIVEIALRLLLNKNFRRWLKYFLKKSKGEEETEEIKTEESAEAAQAAA